MNSISFQHLYSAIGYITVKVEVYSGVFSGSSTFCMSNAVLKSMALQLQQLYETLSGTYQVDDYDSDDFVRFECLKHGHVQITGQVGGSYNNQFLNYQFETDQTALKQIIMELQLLISKTVEA